MLLYEWTREKHNRQTVILSALYTYWTTTFPVPSERWWWQATRSKPHACSSMHWSQGECYWGCKARSRWHIMLNPALQLNWHFYLCLSQLLFNVWKLFALSLTNLSMIYQTCCVLHLHPLSSKSCNKNLHTIYLAYCLTLLKDCVLSIFTWTS